MHLRRVMVLLPTALFMVAATHAANDREVTGLVFLPDGQTVVSASLNDSRLLASARHPAIMP